MIDEATIQQVRDKIDIVDLVSHYVPTIDIKRRGANHMARCPFHNERTPSFVMNPSRNTCHCFSCKKGGDGIAFVMELTGKNFLEAVEDIANYYGIRVYHERREQTDEEKALAKKKEAMTAINEIVQSFFIEELLAKTPEAEKARKYAYGRWGEEFCGEAGIGYAPASWDALIDFANRRCLDIELMKELCLIKKSDKSGRLYPFFRERITIPIKDKFGKTIGFTARYIGDDPEMAKYMNSKDSVLFKKGKTVFGLDVASRQAARNGRFIVVEGAPDVLSMHREQVNLTETVAALGTAWTEDQFKLLKKSASRIVFMPDADVPKEGERFGAGVKAVMKNGQTAMSLGFDVAVREIPLLEVPIMEDLTEEEIEELIFSKRKEKLADLKKRGHKVKIEEIELTEEELAEIPRQKQVSAEFYKQDPDSYITSKDVFNELEDEHFAVWYAKKCIEDCETETDRNLAVNSICRDVLVHVSDETLKASIISNVAKFFGSVRLWRNALERIEKEIKAQRRKDAESKLTGDLALLHDLGISIRDGGYASPGKEGLEQWSNFTMQPMFHIIDGNNAIRIFKLKNYRGTIRELEFRQDELIGVAKFQQRVESVGDFLFKGNITHLQNLRQYLYAMTNSAFQISKLGWNATERLYAFGDGVVYEGTFHPANELGIVNIEDKSFYLPAFSKMHQDEREAYQFERAFSCKRHGEISLHDYLQKMVTVFGDNAKVGFAFLLATLFLDIVKETSKRLALLNIFGRKGSGKTELGTALMSFFIKQNDPPSLATTSLASLNDMLSCAENNLVHLDEYKNAIHFQKIELLKQIWGGTGQTKKNMDGDKKVQRTFVHSGVILTGQDKPNRDDALFSRVIYLSYSQTSFSKEAKQRFDEFQQISSRGVVHLTQSLLRLRPVFETDYAAHYSSCKRDLVTAFAEEKIEDRVLNNWLAPLAAFRTAEHSLDLPFDYKDLLNFCIKGIRTQNEELCKKSDVAEFWSMLDANHMQGKIVDKAHFFIRYERTFTPAEKKVGQIDFGNSKALLYLNFQSVVNTLVQRSVTGGSIIGRLDPSSLESYLRTHEAYLGTKQMRFRVLLPNGQPDVTYDQKDGKSIKRIKEVRPKSMVFDYDFLREAYDLNLETYERMEGEIPEEPAKEDDIPLADRFAPLTTPVQGTLDF